MAQSTPRQNRPFILAAIAALVLAAATFAVFSYSTSNQMDRSAASTGSSTDPKAPNILQDQVNKQQPPATTGSQTNVPPATSPR